MLRARRFVATVLLSSIFTSYAGAQTALTLTQQQEAKASAPAVTASASGGGARYAAPGEVLQIRLEIYAATGELVFDSGQRAGGVLDWTVADVQQGMADGSYISVVTVKDLRGKLSQRLGSVTLQGGNVTLGRAAESELAAAQSQAVSAARESRKIESLANDDSALTILRDGKDRAVTVTTHDGQNGQVTSTSGALTLSTGDVLTGKDKEHVRVTPTGQVGIGTDNPEATLDVAGTIRAQGGIRFADGTVLNSAGKTPTYFSTHSASTATVGPGMTPSVAGTGTTNRLTKWTDANGTLGDSAFSEFNGKIGLGINTPAVKFDVVEETGKAQPVLQFRDSAANSPRARLHAGTEGGVTKLFFEMWKDNLPSKAVAFGMANPGNLSLSDDFVFATYNGTAWSERMRIQNATGNLGIGTTNPTQKLEVVGNIKLTGAGSKLFFADGTSMTTAPSDNTMTGTSIISAINDPATTGFIGDNRLSGNIARINGANTWSGANVFNFGLSANTARITNVGNPVDAGDAANKA